MESQETTRLALPDEKPSRNWMPLIIATGVVVVVVLIVLLAGGHKKSTTTAVPPNAAADPYATSLPVTDLAMSESSNLAGGKVTYIDGKIANHGSRTITAVTVQVIFRSYTNEVAQNETLPLTLIRTREPYVDTEPISAAPLKPGAQQEFRLIFDQVSADWAGSLPEIKILHVEPGA